MLEPGSAAAVIVWENTWAAPFGSAVRRSGGQLVASGRIHTQALIAAVKADRQTAAGNEHEDWDCSEIEEIPPRTIGGGRDRRDDRRDDRGDRAMTAKTTGVTGAMTVATAARDRACSASPDVIRGALARRVMALGDPRGGTGIQALSSLYREP